MSDIKIKQDVWQPEIILVGYRDYYSVAVALFGDRKAIELARDARRASNVINYKMLDQ